jgi:Ser/Thr protein kinase RdoA (MazF antagonist)
LIRFGTHANFHLHGTPFVLRIARPEIGLEVPEKEIQVARLLALGGVPAVRAESTAPVEVDGCGSSLWNWEPQAPEPSESPARRFGALLRCFHGASIDVPGLAEWDGLDAVRGYLGIVLAEERLPAADRELLVRLVDELSADLRPYPTQLGVGVVHGDAHLGNTLWSVRGLLLLDFETVAIAPREMDLVPLAVANRRFGFPSAALAAFLDGYGEPAFDLGSEQFETACQLRELLTTTWLASTEPDSEELRIRLATWRGESDAPWGAR